MADKVFVGSAKKRTGTYGEFFSVSFSKKDYETMAEHLNEKGYVNLVMNERKEVGKYGDTHSLSIDTFVPKSSVVSELRKKSDTIDVSDIPF